MTEQDRITELETRLSHEQDIRIGLFRTVENLATTLRGAQELERIFEKLNELGVLRNIDARNEALSQQIVAALAIDEAKLPPHNKLIDTVARMLASAAERPTFFQRYIHIPNWRIYRDRANRILYAIREADRTVHTRRQLMACEALLRECKEVALDKNNPPQARLDYIAWILDHISSVPQNINQQ